MNALNKCPECGSDSATSYSSRAFGIAGWTTDCKNCIAAPRVTRFTKEDSQAAWNRLTEHSTAPQGGGK